MPFQIGDVIKKNFDSMTPGELGGVTLTIRDADPPQILLSQPDYSYQLMIWGHQPYFPEDVLSDSKLQDTKSKSASINILSSRPDFCELARIPKTKCFPIPSMFSAQDRNAKLPICLADTILNIERDFGYPVFIKPDDGSLGKNACSVYSRQALTDALIAIFQNNQKVIVQEKIEIDREYRCVCFNNHTYLVFDRMFKERGIENGRVDDASVTQEPIEKVRHVTDHDLWQRLEKASLIALGAHDLKYIAADYALDVNGAWWFVEVNTAPLISNAYTGIGISQMDNMARDMITYVRDYE